MNDDESVGVGPHPLPWPDDPRLDPELLAQGDRRNVVDKYRYWHMDAIIEDLDKQRHPFHVAVENWQHDANIGALVRNANAFCASAVHIVGRRKWNRRGAMMTEKYQHVLHHEDMDKLLGFASENKLTVIGIDNIPGSIPIHTAKLPEKCILLFGQESTGLSESAQKTVHDILKIEQYGSTRSINAGAASAVAMYEWCRRYAKR